MCFFSNVAWKTFVKDYLTFSKKDRLAVLAVLFLLAAMYLLPRLFSKPSSTLALKEDSLLIKAVDTLKGRSAQKRDDESASTLPNYVAPQENRGFTEGELFRFDPNTLPAEGWQKLGLNAKTTRILINYRNKGGTFYQPEDLKKVWTLPEGFYLRVKDYIAIAPRERPAYSSTYTAVPYTYKERKIEPVDINEGDTAAFIALPGIGPVLASRIINFRNKLGGFHSVEQVGETYGLPDSTFQKLKPYFSFSGQEVHRLNINRATKEELSAHPYISWKLANAIVEYRNQHGPYQSIDDLKNILILDEATLQKISNYIAVE